MRIEVCYVLPDRATRIDVILEEGATLGDAVVASGIEARLSLDRTGLTFAIFGRRAATDAPLHDGDRVEILRPLIVDPKEARRLRARKRAAQDR